jgi:hypothetical protein
LIGLMMRGFRLSTAVIMTVLLGGLLLSFSRGAWAHFAISAAVGVVLLLVSHAGPAHARASCCSAFSAP